MSKPISSIPSQHEIVRGQAAELFVSLEDLLVSGNDELAEIIADLQLSLILLNEKLDELIEE